MKRSVEIAFDAAVSALSPAMNVRTTTDGDDTLVSVSSELFPESWVKWPGKRSFLFGGSGFMSIFEFISEYADSSPSGMEDRFVYGFYEASRRLQHLAALKRVSSPEELALRLSVACAGKGRE